MKRARLILTNSEAAREQVIGRVGISPERVRVVYYGIDSQVFHPPTAGERSAARRKLSWPETRPVAIFIGALGHDRNKGFDLVFEAWERLCGDPEWDVDLVALGGGAEVDVWRERAISARLPERVRLQGFSKDVRTILAAADVLVSPTHYDAYGLGVQEALCCGLPAFVTRSAGVAERYPDELSNLLLSDPPDVDDLIFRLRHWRREMKGQSMLVAPFSDRLRSRTWTEMAREITDLLELEK